MTPKNILVVDDQPDIRSTIRTILEQDGHTVTEAVSGDDALAKLKRFTPDIIFMDIMMPGTPVIEVVRKINGPKIVYVSAVNATDTEKKELTQKHNISAFIQKPFTIKDITACVKKLSA